jgi:Ran GTPase-activating protein (RanGAP) involved in mRNA processing and transport
LKKLDLSKNSIAGMGVEYLLRALNKDDSLEELNLSSNFLKNSGLSKMEEYLSNNTKLKNLDLSNNLINENALDPIKNTLLKNKGIQAFNILNNNFSQKSLVELHYNVMTGGIKATIKHDQENNITIFESYFAEKNLGEIKEYYHDLLKIKAKDANVLDRLFLPEYFIVNNYKFPINKYKLTENKYDILKGTEMLGDFGRKLSDQAGEYWTFDY